jgi:hypothetical protein
LRSPNNYFLNRQTGGGYDPDIFAVAKCLQPGVSVASQEVVLVFVNNNYEGSANRWQTYSLNATQDGRNWFGIETDHNYNVVDLASTNPATLLWDADRTGTDVIGSGITVGLTGNAFAGQQAQFLRLVDRSQASPDTDGDGLIDAADPDRDNDGLPDWWELANGLSPYSATGDDGASGDPDGDGRNNYQEFLAGTHPKDGASVLKFTRVEVAGGNASVDWTTVPGRAYVVEAVTNLAGATGQRLFFGTANGATNTVTETVATNSPPRFYRGQVVP